jgi:transposase
MLSRRRKEARDGVLRGSAPALRVKVPPAREVKQLQALRRTYALLQEEHALLRKAIRFCSARRRSASRSLTANEGPSR